MILTIVFVGLIVFGILVMILYNGLVETRSKTPGAPSMCSSSGVTT
jgi:hypothetical protein